MGRFVLNFVVTQLFFRLDFGVFTYEKRRGGNRTRE